MKMKNDFGIVLPRWVGAFAAGQLEMHGGTLSTPEQRMQLAVALAAENVRQDTGGPFGAIVVEQGSGELISVGVNLVTQLNLSLAHAEMVALSLAQEFAGSWDLGAKGSMQLVTSCEPCAMCMGAVPWSGVDSLVCGASTEDAEACGFDEGDKPPNWRERLERRGIPVMLNVLRPEAARVLREYADRDGVIYHPERS